MGGPLVPGEDESDLWSSSHGPAVQREVFPPGPRRNSGPGRDLDSDLTETVTDGHTEFRLVQWRDPTTRRTPSRRFPRDVDPILLSYQ